MYSPNGSQSDSPVRSSKLSSGLLGSSAIKLTPTADIFWGLVFLTRQGAAVWVGIGLAWIYADVFGLM